MDVRLTVAIRASRTASAHASLRSEWSPRTRAPSQTPMTAQQPPSRAPTIGTIPNSTPDARTAR